MFVILRHYASGRRAPLPKNRPRPVFHCPANGGIRSLEVLFGIVKHYASGRRAPLPKNRPRPVFHCPANGGIRSLEVLFGIVKHYASGRRAPLEPDEPGHFAIFIASAWLSARGLLEHPLQDAQRNPRTFSLRISANLIEGPDSTGSLKNRPRPVFHCPANGGTRKRT